MEKELTALKIHQACPDCGSSDALTINTDNSTKCYSCDTFTPNGKNSTPRLSPMFVQGDFQDLVKRKISEKVCRLYDYKTAEYEGKKCHVASYKDSSGVVVGQKIRFPDKTFKIIGDVKTPYGWQRFSDGRYIVVTEGEIDALSVSEVFDGKYPVVSIPNGALQL